MAILKKNINYRKNRNDARSESSLKFSVRRSKVDAHLQKLNEENWKHNLIGLYFDVALSNNEIITANTRTHLLFLKNLDIADRLLKAEKVQKKSFMAGIARAYLIFAPQYEAIYELLGKDMDRVKQELQNNFQTN